MLLQGARIKLRAIEEKDAEAIWRMRNDMETANSANMFAPMPTSLFSVKERITEKTASHDITEGFQFVIQDENGDFIGIINGALVDMKNRNLMLGITLASAGTRNKGYGTEAIQVFLEYCFLELNMHRVWLGVFSFNPGGVRCYEKCGFQREAVSRKRVYRNGGYHDEIIMGILKGEYLAQRENKNG